MLKVIKQHFVNTQETKIILQEILVILKDIKRNSDALSECVTKKQYAAIRTHGNAYDA